MLMITEKVASRLVTMREAIDAVAEAFVQLHRGEATIFPVVSGRGSTVGTFFGVKSGVIDRLGLAGFKIGTYWPGNRLLEQPAHASTTFLLDAKTGALRALLASSNLTALRTAAADGVAIRHLSRAESSVVGLVGAGHQAWYELQAACEVRPIKRALIWNRTADAAQAFARRARDELHIDAVVADLRDAVEAADILITATASRQTLVIRDWVRPGTHISAMGSDAAGKQELSTALVAQGRLFADVIDQSITLGDYESAFQSKSIDLANITTIGSVVAGDSPGRSSASDITIFDSSGTALQDLVIGELALARAIAQGLAEEIDNVGK
jgi:alanine dehydrogenase